MSLTRSLALAAAAAALVLSATAARATDEKAKCPVSGKEFTVTETTPTVLVNGQKVQFCCANCPKAFAANPEKYIASAGNCPVAGDGARAARDARTVINNNLYYVCCPGCTEGLVKTPGQF